MSSPRRIVRPRESIEKEKGGETCRFEIMVFSWAPPPRPGGGWWGGAGDGGEADTAGHPGGGRGEAGQAKREPGESSGLGDFVDPRDASWGGVPWGNPRSLGGFFSWRAGRSFRTPGPMCPKAGP